VRAHGRRRLGSVAVSLVALAGLAVTAQPVMADGCIPTVAGFPPGHWIARGITVRGELSDAWSTSVVTGTGGFDLTVARTGEASGTMSLVGDGYTQSFVEGDDSSSTASYIKTGNLSGSATHIEVNGTIDLQMEGVIDVEPGHDGDLVNPSGQDLFGFENDIQVPFSSELLASAASCTTVFGSLTGPAEYGVQDETDEAIFLAVRADDVPAEVDLQGQLQALLDEARDVLNTRPVNLDALGAYVRHALAFEALLASMEACDPGSELGIDGPWALLQSTLYNTIGVLLQEAGAGNVSTHDLITAIAVWTQGGSLGWRDDDCLAVDPVNDAAFDRLIQFEELLVGRYHAAHEVGDRAEMAEIAAAGYQYGLPRVIAAVEGD
jgi:hypothetical protein